MVVYEIEDSEGNTICSFRVVKDRIVKTKNCEVADEDKDYLFITRDKLVRLQLEEEE
jgi:hypothetical protein